jgi:pimeloyl-ACP methyl ester carboxylesterase
MHDRATVNGINLHYVHAAPPEPTGDAVVLLHGWPETSYAWRKIIPALSERVAVLAPDLRGAGHSERRGPYDKATMAADVLALCDLLGHRRIVAVGHDMGAIVAYALAAVYPDRVTKLVVLEMILPGFGLEEATHIRRGFSTMWHIPLHLAPRGHAEALTHGREDVYLHRFLHDSLYDPTSLTDEDRAHYLRAYQAPGAMAAGFEWYRTLFDDADWIREAAARRRLDIPVLAIGGAHRIGDAVRASLAGVADDVVGEVWERCGHYPHEEQPDRLNSRLLEFCQR